MMRRRSLRLERAALLALLAGTAFGSASAIAVQAPDGDAGSTAESRVAILDLSRPSDPGKTFAATTVIDAGVQKLCSIILDYPSYPEFMPNTDRTKVIQRGRDYALVDMTLGLPLGKIKRYRLRMEPRVAPHSCRLDWKLVPRKDLQPEDTIADTSGYWRLGRYHSRNDRTLVEYVVYADPGPVPFGLGWIVDMMSRDSLPRTLEAVRERARAH